LDGSTCRQRMIALHELGHRVELVNTEPNAVRVAQGRFMYRVGCKLYRMGWNSFGPRDLAGENQKILDSFRSQAWDILWIDKGLTIEPVTLQEIRTRYPNTTIVGYSPDDMFARHNQSRQFLAHLPLYDVFFTTKSCNVGELKSLGCPKVIFIGNAFDPASHRPMAVTASDVARLGGPVGFIGSYELDRAESICYLASKGIRVRIWGSNWGKLSCRSTNLVVEKMDLLSDQYALGINAFNINLCFLRKINRDLQTTRSIEIPACGAFMLAERTQEHLELFEEGREAEFFNSNEEMLEKVKYYIANSAQRERIATAGRQRCLKSGYSNHDRLREMLKAVELFRH
jgi:spore maturation protein CgeB